jgi:HEXXH motif-containing protein
MPQHKLPRAEFDELGRGSASAATIRHLRLTNRSKHLLMLEAALAHAPPEARGPLPSADTAWELLVRVQEVQAMAVETVVTHPTVGVWLAHVLRRFEHATVDPAPLWSTFGYLHCMAAAAAIHAGIPFGIQVPANDGEVMLPTVGLARMPKGRQRWEVASVIGGPGRLRVRGGLGTVQVSDLTTDSDMWFASRKLNLRHGNTAIRVWLDDLDPYRGFARPMPPNRLDATEAGGWRTALASTWELLVEQHPRTARELAAGLTTLVPHDAVGPFQPYSASSKDAFGCVALSLPPTTEDFAATLVHEFQHSKLTALLELIGFYESDQDTERYYSPWRDDPRPLAGVLQGTYSFLGVAGFWRVQRKFRDTPLAQFEFALGREQARRAAQTLRYAAKLTKLGRRFVAMMTEQLTAWCAEPVPNGPLWTARLAIEDHYACWRLRNLRPNPDYTGLLGEAWLADMPHPHDPEPPPVMPPAGEVPDEPVPRTLVIRTAFTDSGQFQAIQADPSLLPGTTEPDLALARSDITSAMDGFLDLLRTSPRLASPWAGLGHTLSATRDHRHAKAVEALRHRPELIRAVYRKITAMSGSAPDPLLLAAWIGTTPPGLRSA